MNNEIVSRDYLSVKVWDLHMETKPIETYTVRRQLSYYQSILNLKLSRSTNICAPSCVPCMRMIASLISSSVAGTETTPRL